MPRRGAVRIAGVGAVAPTYVASTAGQWKDRKPIFALGDRY